MRYSVPSVAFAVGGVPEVVTDGENGLLAPLGDSKALKEALERLITNDDLRHRLSRGARRSFEKKFGSGLMVERLEALYRGVIGATKAAA
jgi:glycosyltransferase involved in cell wall biosynthesis